MRIKPDKLKPTLTHGLRVYSSTITEMIKKAADEEAKAVKAEAAAAAPRRTGTYARAFRVKTLNETQFERTKVIYVFRPHYRLTHLLERGHRLVSGGKARSFPHMKPAEEHGRERLSKRIEEIIKEASK